jgi:hypothetical protein
MILFLFFNILLQYTFLFFNFYNIKLILFIIKNILQFYYFTIYNNNKVNKNIYLELKPLLLILQQLDDINQIKILNKLDKKYNNLSLLYPIKKDYNIDQVIKNYLYE